MSSRPHRSRESYTCSQGAQQGQHGPADRVKKPHTLSCRRQILSWFCWKDYPVVMISSKKFPKAKERKYGKTHWLMDFKYSEQNVNVGHICQQN